jgi:hypothetical protein
MYNIKMCDNCLNCHYSTGAQILGAMMPGD